MTVGESAQCSDLRAGNLANPLGPFTAITTVGQGICGTRTDGYLVCLGSRSSTILRPPAGDLSSITSSGSNLCGVTRDGSIECWGATGDSPSKDFRTGPFTSLDVGGWSCALKGNGSAICPDANRVGLETPEGPFSSIDTGWGNRTGEGIACGVKRDGSAICWGPEWEVYLKGVGIPEGHYSQISVGGYACGIRTDGSIACWGQPFDAGKIPEDLFSSVSVGTSHACGLKTDGTVRCWGNDNSGQAYSPPGTFTAVAAGGSISCGLKSDGMAMCWGATQPR